MPDSDISFAPFLRLQRSRKKRFIAGDLSNGSSPRAGRDDQICGE